MDNRRRLSVMLLGASLSLLLSTEVSAVSECRRYFRCGECISQNPTCAWCDDVTVLRRLAADSNTSSPAQLCGTREELQALNCRNIISPPSTVTAQTVPSVSFSSFVSPTSATVNLRPGTSASFNIEVSPPESAAVDMYLLLDLSTTMQGRINALRDLAEELVMRMKQLSSDFRIGFGSFVDKPVPPFTDKFRGNFPCDPLAVSSSRCEATYSYRHVLDFTSNATELQSMLDATKFSASIDDPESILDGMLQTAVCEDEIGWRPRGQSQRIIVAFTDADYHYAFDGKIGGIVAPPSATECRLDPVTGEYKLASRYDYPSSTLIADVLNANQITPIFAVPSSQYELYKQLERIIRSASVGILSSQSENVIGLIETQYRILSGTVVPTLTFDDFGGELDITVLPADDCFPGQAGSVRDSCAGINFPNSTNFTVQVSASTSACQLEGPITAQIQFIRFGVVNVSIGLHCDCDCAEPEENSPTCMNQGTLECSTCICDDNIGGATCNCPRRITTQPELGCVDPQDPENRECNGQGSCNCGRCQCNPIAAGSSLRYQGEFCQFDPLNCPQARDENGIFTPCAGNGDCTNSRCECVDGYTGGACDCTTDTSTCRPEGREDLELCSGVGECICGQCICNNYSINFGEFCEQCQPCRAACSMVSPCVMCMVMGGAECDEDLLCDQRLAINDTVEMTSNQGMKVCSLRQGSCEVRYFLGSDVQGDEASIQIFLDSSQDSLVTLGEGSSSCNPSTPIWPIFVGIILGTIFVGILVIILWRCFTYLGEYLEFQQWKKSVETTTERSGENPLFVDPNAQYANPRYRPVPM